MAKNSTFNISLRLLDQNFKKGISGIQKQIRGFANFVKASFALGSITAFGRQIVQVSSEFEDSMARVKAVSNAGAEGFRMMSEEARKLGATTRYTATEAANALENLTRNGMSAAQATTALSGTLQLAQANAIGLAEAAEIVSNTLNMFGLSAKEVTRVNDVLSSVASTTATNVSQAYAALVNVAPTAVSLGLSLEETAAAVGAFAQKGVKAEQAGTQLRVALLKMVEPSTVAKMKKLGIEVDENVIKTEGLIGAVKRLSAAHLTTSQMMETFGVKSGNAILQLVNSYKTLELELEIVKSSAGTTARMFEQGVGTTKKAVDTLKSTYEAFLISLGSKTSGVVNGVVNFLTKLIKNFETVEGSLANIASVIVPLFTKRVMTMFTVFSTGAKKAAVDALTLKAAMGDWITLIATAATWLITGLIANASKLNKEIKENNRQIADLNTRTDVLKGRVTTLMEKLGPNTDTATLAGVIKELTTLFPDFTKEIMNAATEAGKTGKYEKLKGLLQDIVTLQHTMSVTALLQGAIQMNAEQGANRIMTATRYTERRIGNSEIPVSTSEFEQEMVELREAVENGLRAKNYKGQALTDETKKLLTYAVGEMHKNYSIEETARNIQTIFKGFGVEVSDILLKSVTLGMQQTAEGIAGFEANKDLRAAQEAQELATMRTAKAQQEAADAAERDAKNKEEAANKSKRIADIEKEYKSAILAAEDDYKLAGESAGALRIKLLKLAEAAQKAYEAYRKEEGENGTGEKNPYYNIMLDAKNAADSNRKAATKFLGPGDEGRFSEQNRVVNTGKQKGPTGLKTDRYDIPEIADYAVYVDDAIRATNTFANTLSTLKSAFDTLSDANASWLDKLTAATRILESVESAVFSVMKLINQLGDAEVLAAKKEEIAALMGIKTKKKEIAADTGKAVSGAAASQSMIPYVGPILAVAAVASILAVIAASVPKFANGGIIQGSSKYGDRLLARVNAGEAILNQQQQKRLLDIADGRATNGGQAVQFFISGKDLVGCIRNNNAATSRISGSKGM